MEGTLYVSGNYSHFEIVDPSTGAVLISFDGHEKAGKCFPGDTVVWKDTGAGGVAELQLTGNKRVNIVGTLELTSKTIHGHTKKGVPMYIFTPYSKEYPPFVVASSEKNRSVNLLCSVNFLEWKTGSPLPRGSIQKVFGLVGRLADEMSALLEYVAPIKQVEDTGDIDRELTVAQEMVQHSEVERGIVRKHLPSEYTFNIDPEGCRDIDDVITLIPVGSPEDNKWRLIVSIADVSSYVPDMGAIDNIAEMIGQSVYDDRGRVVRPMLPLHLSEGRCSLIQGATRRTISAEVVWCGG
jgi:exoribonuclease R